MKNYTISYRRVRFMGPDRPAKVVSGTLDYLIDYFRYTLDCGRSWDAKVNTNPKTGASLVSNLNKASAASCNHYQDTYYDLVG